MSTKFAIRNILVASSVFALSVMSPTASALVSSTTVSGCSLYKKSLGQCSVFVDGILKGLGSVTKTPTAFTATMARISGTIFCLNPAGNSAEANGVPFSEIPVAIAGADAIEQVQVQKNGKALSEIVFHDPAIIAAIKTAVQVPDCQSNWIQAIVVTKMEVMGQQWQDPSPSDASQCLLTGENLEIDNTCVLVDTLRTSCQIQDPYFQNPVSALGVGSYNYVCAEVCHSTDPAQCDLNTPTTP